ncbi:FtsX-like permease family protein [Sinosporangium siamense]|uniref:Membrane protein n=1 Tax=Sinosporangium siamense TaxID=1367973 RepID=A0A919REY3_9ACTN|nr:ABC transporter permease [Sinosporangium siamense]GII91169.1 membrane protein [Sinosporangium siamense]
MSGRAAGHFAYGALLAVRGGATGWTRMLLTGVAIGLGVAFLLLAAAIPTVMDGRDARLSARTEPTGLQPPPRGDDTLLMATYDTLFRDQVIVGRILQVEGRRAPIPPGLPRLPQPGEMMVSPALAELLAASDGALLRLRLPWRVAATIGAEGLEGPAEHMVYIGSGKLDESVSRRVRSFGNSSEREGLPPALILLTIIALIVLLLPVAVFVAAAIRFGGESRDRRFAVLRLVGADMRMIRSFAVGEAMVSALLGLLFGGLFFLAGRQLAQVVSLWRMSVYPSDITPNPILAVLVVLLIPLLTVLVTLNTLRNVAYEPLGVVRRSHAGRRRVWWRLLFPVLGLVMLAPLLVQRGDTGVITFVLAAGGTALLLTGVATLLPWLVEVAVRPLGAGAVPWQLAVRRIQADSASAARLVTGISVAMAGGIALQTLVTGMQSLYTTPTGADLGRAQMRVAPATELPRAERAKLTTAVTESKGVRSVIATTSIMITRPGNEQLVPLIIGSCAELRQLAEIATCAEGDVFIGQGKESTPLPGEKVTGKDLTWTIPADAAKVTARPPQGGEYWDGVVLTTPAAAPKSLRDPLALHLFVNLNSQEPDAAEHVRNTVAAYDPLMHVSAIRDVETNTRFDAIVRGIYSGTAGALALIGLSMLATVLDGLRERRRLLASLAAFGTRRSTLSWSTLWEAVIPLTLGLAVAGLIGTVLGAVLLRMLDLPVLLHATPALAITGAGVAVILLVTVLSLPLQCRLTRPEELRTE